MVFTAGVKRVGTVAGHSNGGNPRFCGRFYETEATEIVKPRCSVANLKDIMSLLTTTTVEFDVPVASSKNITVFLATESLQLDIFVAILGTL